nr:C-GCAxxG-C-C family protein [uncultured Anaeromusa sp.]
MSNEKRVQQAVEAFMNGKSCSQAVFCVYGPALGIPEEAALRISSAFGGGMGNLSEACGAATGAFMAIGAKGLPKEETYALVQTFAKDFETRYGSLHCTRLLGFDLSTENGREGRKKSGIGHEHCAQYVQGSAEILERLLFADATK